MSEQVSMAEKWKEREIREQEDMFNNVFQAELAFKAENAARNFRLKSVGLEATDVLATITIELLQRIRSGETLDGIVEGLLANSKQAPLDPTTKEARSLAMGKLAATLARRLYDQARKERPVGDSSAVVGEESPKEQEGLSEASGKVDANGADRQMRAVLARQAEHRGLHRADVLGVADDSRLTMKDNLSRWMRETEQEVLSDLIDRPWTPATEEQEEIWDLVFGWETPADVLFGLDPTTGAHPEEQNYSDRSVYPTNYPYKPMRMTHTRSQAPIPGSQDFKHHADRCGAEGHIVKKDHDGDSNPWVTRGNKQVAVWRLCCFLAGKNPASDSVLRDADGKPCKWNSLPKHPKTCPPGKVTNWPGIVISTSLAEDAVKGLHVDTREEDSRLRRALRDWRRSVLKGVREYWLAEAATMSANAHRDATVAEIWKIGQGVPMPLSLSIAANPGHKWNVWPEEGAEGKDARRFALLQGLGNLAGRDSQEIMDAFTIENDRYLPGQLRWSETLYEMWVAPVRVEGRVSPNLEGQFVSGLPGVMEEQRRRNDGRKFVKVLCDNGGYIAAGFSR